MELGQISEIFICGNKVYPDAESHQQDAEPHWAIQDPRGSISSVEDLLLMPNLETVVLDRQPLSDLEPLTRLPWLEKLSLCQCLITDLTPLARCPWLRELDLQGNPLRDLSPVAGCHSLKTLRIPQTEVTDISALRGMRLEVLDVSHLKIEDYSVLDTLSLREFCAINLPESAFPSLSRMRQLDRLSIVGGHYQDLRPFSTLPALGYLNVALGEIDDYSDMSGFPVLYFLDLYAQKLTSLAPFLTLDKLQYMILSYSTIEDISALPRFTWLKELWVDAGLAQRIAQTFPGVEFPFKLIIDQRPTGRESPPVFGRHRTGDASFPGGYRDEYL
jgi:Leucine-rich repeat (LRR) protein